MVSGTGQGKSTFTKELIHHLLMNDQKVGVLALEEANKRTALALVGVHMNRNIVVDRSLATDEEVVEAFRRSVHGSHLRSLRQLGQQSDRHDLPAADVDVLEAMGLHTPFSDHISLLVSGNEGDDRKNLDIAATKLRTLCQETGLHLFTVSHLKRPDGRGHEDGGAVSLSQVRGSTAIAGLSDTVLGLQKDPENPDSDLQVLRVLKNRYRRDRFRRQPWFTTAKPAACSRKSWRCSRRRSRTTPETAEGENDESSE